MSGIDNGMGPGPGSSSSDYSGSCVERHCIGCGCELGMWTPARWGRADVTARLCGVCSKETETVAYWERRECESEHNPGGEE